MQSKIFIKSISYSIIPAIQLIITFHSLLAFPIVLTFPKKKSRHILTLELKLKSVSSNQKSQEEKGNLRSPIILFGTIIKKGNKE